MGVNFAGSRGDARRVRFERGARTEVVRAVGGVHDFICNETVAVRCHASVNQVHALRVLVINTVRNIGDVQFILPVRLAVVRVIEPIEQGCTEEEGLDLWLVRRVRRLDVGRDDAALGDLHALNSCGGRGAQAVMRIKSST